MVREVSQQYAPKTKKNSVRFGRASPERSSTSDLPTYFRGTLPIPHTPNSEKEMVT
jgi:hypothetical protein